MDSTTLDLFSFIGNSVCSSTFLRLLVVVCGGVVVCVVVVVV